MLIQKVPGVDVAVVGHDLGTLNQPEILTKTILVQNSMQGKFLGILDLTIGEKGTIENYTGSMVGITENTPSDPTVLALIREFEKQRDLNRYQRNGKNASARYHSMILWVFFLGDYLLFFNFHLLSLCSSN